MHQDDFDAGDLVADWNARGVKALTQLAADKERLTKENAQLRQQLAALESTRESRQYVVRAVDRCKAPGTELYAYRIETDQDGLQYVIAIQGSVTDEEMQSIQSKCAGRGVAVIVMPPGSELRVGELVRK